MPYRTGPRPVRLDLAGKKVPDSRWTVIDRNFDKRVPSERGVFWNCVCECGNTAVIKTGNLVYGLSRSCGCLAKEINSVLHKKHGKVDTRIYRCWINMKSRCTNSNSTEFPNYGQRGITICKEWLESFEAFYEHVGDAPSEEHTLDRINVNGNYEPGNTRWATRAEQNANKRKIGRVEQFTTEELIAELKRRNITTF